MIKLTMFLYLFSCLNFSNSEDFSRKEVNQCNENEVSFSEMKRVSFLNEKLSLLIPDDFSQMGNYEIQRKYPGANRPNVVWANSDGDVSVNFSNTNQLISPDELDNYADQVVQGVKASLSSGNWIGYDTFKINNQKISILEFTSQAMDGQIYNLLCLTSVNGSLVIYSFNCMNKDKEEWQFKGRQIVESIKLH